jgi:hypothetical protein
MTDTTFIDLADHDAFVAEVPPSSEENVRTSRWTLRMSS